MHSPPPIMLYFISPKRSSICDSVSLFLLSLKFLGALAKARCIWCAAAKHPSHRCTSGMSGDRSSSSSSWGGLNDSFWVPGSSWKLFKSSLVGQTQTPNIRPLCAWFGQPRLLFLIRNACTK